MENNFFEGYQKTIVTARLMRDKAHKAIDFPSNKAKASEIPEEYCMPDLLYVKFVLASEHENSNADYFSRSEMVQARHTPIHKPFNVEHMLEEDGSYISEPLFNQTKNTIIGHMVSSALAKKDGTILTEEEIAELDLDDNPARAKEEQLDIIGSAVLYKFCFPKTVADIEELIDSGDMKVSMECWFKGYDYLVGDSIVERSEATSHHDDDWHHRKVIGGRCVSRVLRGILFGGVAATEKPANEESVFLATANERKLKKLMKRHGELHILHAAASEQEQKEYEKEHVFVTKAIKEIIEGENENE